MSRLDPFERPRLEFAFSGMCLGVWDGGLADPIGFNE